MKTQLFTKLTVSIKEFNHRLFKKIKAGNYYLSIQGSMFHYCKPRETIDYELYEEMEVGIFSKNNTKQLLNLKRMKNIKQFNRYNELIERLSGDTIIAYAPIDLINDLYIFLCKQYENTN